ncbi:MAG: baseplate J/gp47 family protein [Mangrovibacterium sp.]
MADCGKDLFDKRSGTSQEQRFLDALNPDSVKLNDFGLTEWMQFARNFARHVNWFEINSADFSIGNWEPFFPDKVKLESLLKTDVPAQALSPHLALFVCFVRLLGLSQKRFNQLTQKHLDFYYRQILHLEKQPAVPDRLYVLFELAKNVAQASIPNGTELDGGKDASGSKLVYETTSEFVGNQAKVTSLKTVYADYSELKMKAAPCANSYDGLGKAFPDKIEKWWPFGYVQAGNFPELSDAKLGFAVASDVLSMAEGLRSIQLKISFKNQLPAIDFVGWYELFDVYCTGEKGWIGPVMIQASVLDGDDIIFSSSVDNTQKQLCLAFQIPREEKALVDWNEKLHGEQFCVNTPVCRLLLKTGNAAAIRFYRKLVDNDIITMQVNVDVRGVKNLQLENDFGALNSKKPFLPFGTLPAKGSNFYLNYPELFRKNWTSAQFKLDWKNTPEADADKGLSAFANLYYAYRNNYKYQNTQLSFLRGMFVEDEDGKWTFVSIPNNLIVAGDDYFRADVEVLNKETWQTDMANQPLFVAADNGFSMTLNLPNNDYAVGKNGPVRLSLRQSFLHELFPRVYALAFSSTDKDALIPNEPYTPMIEQCTLSYTAKAALANTASETAWASTPLRFLHETPFGQTEVHSWLKSKAVFLDSEDRKTRLFPSFCRGGELYIGLEGAQNLQNLSLLVQVLEGSENPQADPFVGKQKVSWAALCADEWKPLTRDELLADETGNFLKSGLVQLTIPAECTITNRLLPSGYTWLRASMRKSYDAVCNVLAIRAQAVAAKLKLNSASLHHLVNGLPAESIGKLVQRLSAVKKVTQPFSSFGGKAEEADTEFYRRVSERLRHKKRAITVWDYEQLILQQFPDIHRVKCLNHTANYKGVGTKKTSFLSPGNVLLVLVPDTANRNAFDPFQPRVSKAQLNTVQDFINQHNSLFIQAEVVNPDYEEVIVSARVKFRAGYDQNYYLNELNDAIIRLLSPWAFGGSAKVGFGQTLHRSFLINYLEKLAYVDYLESVSLAKGNNAGLSFVEPSCPKAILVSARQHQLGTEVEQCKKQFEAEETCQK